MNGGIDSIGSSSFRGELALWSFAGLTVLSIHAAAALWFLQETAMAAPADAPPAAIMIELADTPEAQVTEETEISPDQETASASNAVLMEDAPLDKPEPIEEVTEQQSEPVEDEPETETLELDKVEVPLPMKKPIAPELKQKVDEKEKPQKKPVKQRKQEQAASRDVNQAQAEVMQSNRNAARQSASGIFASSVTPARWQARLMAHLERRKRYPAASKARREEGVAYVRFRIDDAGNVLSASLARSSGYPDLDNEVLALVQRASPVPAPPPDANKTITAPVKFSSKR